MEYAIREVRRLPDSGCVVQVKVALIKSLEGKTASLTELVNLPTKDPADPTFIPFESLTQEQVSQWAVEAIPPLNRKRLEAALDRMLERATTPAVTIPGMPWAQPAHVPEEPVPEEPVPEEPVGDLPQEGDLS